jgi:hypothetical protein
MCGCRVAIVTRRAGPTRRDMRPFYLGDAGRLASMGEREPLGELSSGLIGGGPVERHQRRRYAR